MLRTHGVVPMAGVLRSPLPCCRFGRKAAPGVLSKRRFSTAIPQFGTAVSYVVIPFAKRKKKGAPTESGRPGSASCSFDLVHSAHAAAWAAVTAGSRCGLLGVFLDVGHQGFGGEHQAGNGRGVLESEARDLGWVDNARLDHVAELAGFRVVAVIVFLALADAADDDGPFGARVERDLPQGFLERA